MVAPLNVKSKTTMTKLSLNFYQSTFQTPLGSMTAVADQSHIYLLKFSDTPNLNKTIIKLCKTHQTTLEQGITPAISSLEKELQLYFDGKLKIFATPLFLTGTGFQKLAWTQLSLSGYGTTLSYAQQASQAGNPKAFRAIARANASNLIAIMLPCHRVINKNGNISGYNGGIDKKEWLLNHEQKHK